jgi:hypothetical protein
MEIEMRWIFGKMYPILRQKFFVNGWDWHARDFWENVSDFARDFFWEMGKLFLICTAVGAAQILRCAQDDMAGSCWCSIWHLESFFGYSFCGVGKRKVDSAPNHNMQVRSI